MVVCIRDDSLLELLCKYYIQKNTVKNTRQINNNTPIINIRQNIYKSNNLIKETCNKILNLLNVFKNVRKGSITLSSKIEFNPNIFPYKNPTIFPDNSEIKYLFEKDKYFIEAYCNFIRCLFFNLDSYYKKYEPSSKIYIFLIFHIKDVYNIAIERVKIMEKDDIIELFTVDPKKKYNIKKSTSIFNFLPIRRRILTGTKDKRNEEYVNLKRIINYYRQIYNFLEILNNEIHYKQNTPKINKKTVTFNKSIQVRTFNENSNNENSLGKKIKFTNSVVNNTTVNTTNNTTVNTTNNTKVNDIQLFLTYSKIIKIIIDTLSEIDKYSFTDLDIDNKINSKLRKVNIQKIDLLLTCEYMSLKICRKISTDKKNRSQIENYISLCEEKFNFKFINIKRLFIRNLFIRQPNDFTLSDEVSLDDSYSLLYLIIFLKFDKIEELNFQEMMIKNNKKLLCSLTNLEGSNKTRTNIDMINYIISIIKKKKTISNKSSIEKRDYFELYYLDKYHNNNNEQIYKCMPPLARTLIHYC